jgi:hypothetical protein
MKPKFIYNNIPADLRVQLEAKELEIIQALGLSCPWTLYWHGEAFDDAPTSYFLYSGIRGQLFGQFRGKNVQLCLDRMIRNIHASRPRRKSYIYRIVNLPSRTRSEIVITKTFPTEKNQKPCRRTTNCVWTGIWAAVGGENHCQMIMGGLISEDVALCAAMESLSRHYKGIWGREVKSQCLHEASHPQIAKFVTHQAVVMH